MVCSKTQVFDLLQLCVDTLSFLFLIYIYVRERPTAIQLVRGASLALQNRHKIRKVRRRRAVFYKSRSGCKL